MSDTAARSAVPPWPKFVGPTLDVLDDGESWRTCDLKVEVIARSGLTEAQRADTLNSGRGPEPTIGWALSFLTRAQAVRKIKNGEL
ncbi:winged helix-turn-helix domain-containing protein [Williamsia sp.]|uniref:winged helix-turn-helix domain-containing protein n=1 Tax=Williamsia sp. TaxID=1872085 RepID=UPI002F9571C1